MEVVDATLGLSGESEEVNENDGNQMLEITTVDIEDANLGE